MSCRVCGAETELFPSGRARKVCADCRSLTCGCGQPKSSATRTCRPCRTAARAIPEQTCGFCEVTFTPKESNRIRFCSRDCSFAHMRAHKKQEAPKAPTPCLTCGADVHGRAGYCGDDCRKEMARRKEMVRATQKHMPRRCRCRVCGDRFTPQYGNKARTLCSDVCWAIHDKESGEQLLLVG